MGVFGVILTYILGDCKGRGGIFGIFEAEKNVLFLPTAARKLRKETPLKGERADDSVTKRLGLKY